MSRLAEIAQKVIALIARERDEAREELDDEEFDELDFSDDLEAEFYDDPPAFASKYGQYLESLSATELSVLTNQRARK